MATNSQAALLDQLMGYDRNCNRKTEITWSDDRVCKSYLAGFCPHELFVNTRISLGPCTKIHEEHFLKKYKESSSYLKNGYEIKLKRILQNFVRDIQSKIKYNEEKLTNNYKPNVEIIIENRINSQSKEIDEIVSKIEKLGYASKIEEALIVFSELEERLKQLKYDKIELEKQKEDSLINQDVVCQICGAFTSKNDLKSSVENHIGGKIHSGYVKINEVLKTIDDVLGNSTNSREKSISVDEKRKSSTHNGSTESSDYRRSRGRRERSRDHNKYRTRSRSNRGYSRKKNR